MRKTHELKIGLEYFIDIRAGFKKFELRRDDRGFEVGDEVCLRLYSPAAKEDGSVIGYPGPVARARIEYILRDVPEFGLMEGYAILGLCNIRFEDWGENQMRTCVNCGSPVSNHCKGHYPDTVCENWQPRTCLNCGAPVTKLYCEDHYPDEICDNWRAKKPPSNFDRIQNDSVEELAAFLCEVSLCDNCIAFEYCREGHPGYIDWLREEAEI